MSATPSQRRDAWLTLIQGMERQLISTRENARAMNALTVLEDYTVPEVLATAVQAKQEWEATAWAAGRLLEGLGRLPAPEVPEDPALGQEAIPMPGDERQEELSVGGLTALEAGEGLRRLGSIGWSLGSLSTKGDNPGEDRTSPEVILCGPSPECKDPHPHRWYCMRGRALDDEPGQPGVCPLGVCARRGANTDG